MTILCGTDFTGSSHEAARAAAALAVRCGETLELVHVLDFPVHLTDSDESDVVRRRWSELFEPEAERRRTLLDNEGERLTELGCEVRCSLLSGTPVDALIAAALERDARLIAVASLGGRSPSAWRLGGIADQLALHSPVPVLVVRSARPFETWSSGRDGGAPLSILCALDLRESGEPAAAWVAELEQSGPCEIEAVNVYDLRREARRLGVSPEKVAVERALLRQGTAHLADFAAEARLVLSERPERGHVAEELVRLAETQRADLIVVGSHQRAGFARHWHGSVSYALVPQALTNVVVVPHTAQRPELPGTHFPPRRILVASDLTPAGDRAIEHAYALAQHGAQLNVLHVLQPAAPLAGGYGYIPPPAPSDAEREASDSAARKHLQARVPADAAERGIESEIEVVHEPDVALAIAQAAERASADLVCLATHAHGALATALLGSVAREVVRTCGRPVLLIPPPAS